MQKLELDFAAARRGAAWAGRVFALLAIAFAVDVGASYIGHREAVQQIETRLARLPETAASAPAAPVSPEEWRAARETLDRLSLPWDNLFRALESSASEDIALLAIEPDARSGTALITGESRDYGAALKYVAKLGDAEAVKHVHLLKHELRPETSTRPLMFSVSASWKDPR